MTAALQLLQQHSAHSSNVTKQMQQGNLNATQKLARSNQSARRSEEPLAVGSLFKQAGV
jgi:hypothetical protein